MSGECGDEVGHESARQPARLDPRTGEGGDDESEDVTTGGADQIGMPRPFSGVPAKMGNPSAPSAT